MCSSLSFLSLASHLSSFKRSAILPLSSFFYTLVMMWTRLLYRRRWSNVIITQVWHASICHVSELYRRGASVPVKHFLPPIKRVVPLIKALHIFESESMYVCVCVWVGYEREREMLVVGPDRIMSDSNMPLLGAIMSRARKFNCDHKWNWTKCTSETAPLSTVLWERSVVFGVKVI